MSTIQINDAIHRVIELETDEARVLAHPFVQRLRFIRQLGFVSLVYPCAVHDRFSHALGTLHVTSLMAHQIFYNEEYSHLSRILNEEEKKYLSRIIRLSGLLHDIGHGPFSHTAEDVMPQMGELAIPKEWMKRPIATRRAKHEDYSVLILRAMSEGDGAVLSSEDAHIISSLVHHKVIAVPESWRAHFSKKINTEQLHAIVKLIISSDIDGDRMDYLLRDAHFTGVTYGHFDLFWLISNLGTVSSGDGYAMSVSETGIHALEHYLLARYNMYAQVYMHKTVKCFEYYFQRGLDEGEITYRIPTAVDDYVMMHDAMFLESIYQAARQSPFSWFGRLVRREPAHRLARIWGDQERTKEVYNKLYKELDVYGVRPFLSLTQRKFLDIGDTASTGHQKETRQSLFGGIGSVPIRVVRKQFGVISSAPLADYSFILKKYHQDITVGDIYILRDEFEARADTIQRITKKYYHPSSSETILDTEVL